MYSDRALESARTLTFVAILILVIFFIFGSGLLGIILGYLAVSGIPNLQSGGLRIAATVFSVLFLFGLMWIFLDYFFVYKPLKDGMPEAAYSPALILGILELIFGGIIPGILLILAYSRIGSAIVYKEMKAAKSLERT